MARRREHGGVRPAGPHKKLLLGVPAILIVGFWVGGFLLGGKTDVLCYGLYSALGAVIVSGSVILLLMGTEAHHIARRSIW
jgi:hypothetical protein